MRREVNGILLLDKPNGISSNGALQRAKRLFCAKKAGHTGSLDPIATGMLPLCFGEATKFSQFLLESDKSYVVTAKLGIETTTGDTEGTAVTQAEVNVTAAQIEKILNQFLGEIDQIPPMFSAIKHQGKPLYELARQGIEIERKSRRIKIFSIRLDELSQDTFTMFVHCSKGTYVRTLVQDIGRLLGCGAHVSELRRVSVSPYKNAVMYSLETLEEIIENNGLEGLSACLLSTETSVSVLPAITLTSSSAYYLKMGQPVRVSSSDSGSVRLYAEDGKFLGVGDVMPDGRVQPTRLVN